MQRHMILFLLLSIGVDVRATANIENGKLKAKDCVACHGANGLIANENWPNLAGQNKGYFIKTMKDYRSGSRKDVMMNKFKLTDQELEDLAAYYFNLNR
jgi:cytochrome c553